MGLGALVRRRRMVRDYAPGEVSRQTIEKIVELARHAPSAGFSQGQSFVVVTDAETRAAIARLAGEEEHADAGRPRWISSAPVHVVVCTNKKAYRDRYGESDKGGFDWNVPYWYVDAGASLMLLLLAAVEEGLGAGFFGGHRLEGIADLVGLPDDVTAIGLVTIGHPAPEQPLGSASRGWKPLQEVVRWERW